MSKLLISKQFENFALPLSVTNEQNFYTKNRNIIILTETGKPVYATFGNEYELSPVMATFSILLNKFELNIDQKSPQKPMFFENSKKILVFEKNHQLWYIYILLSREHNYFFLSTILKLIDLKVIL